MLKILSFFFFSIILGVAFIFTSNASGISKAYLFLERMQIGSETEMILMFSPEFDFSPGGELKITFLADIGQWCSESGSIDVVGVDSSPVDMGSWDIDVELPTISFLEATCVPGDVGEEIYDSIVVENIDELSSGISYGVKFENTPIFTTSSSVGEKKIIIELTDGILESNTEIGINLLETDGVHFTAFVSDMPTLTCTISHSNLSFGSLPRENHITIEHSLFAESNLTEGYYWAVSGQGDGTNAGLWKSTIPTSLIPSTGNTTINLVQNSGFGLNAFSVSGTVIQ